VAARRAIIGWREGVRPRRALDPIIPETSKEKAMSTKHVIALATVAVAVVLSTITGMVAPDAATAGPRSGGLTPTQLVTGLEGGAGSTIGPDGALYVTEYAVGRISRVDPRTGAVTTVASGLPASTLGFGGVRDVEFIGRTAYVLVTAVGADVGGSDTVGIYRIDGRDSFAVVADIGAFSMANPPNTQFDLPTGVQYALETYHGGFLVTDGHHNRVLRVKRDGQVSERIAFGNIVPTGLAIRGSNVYMAEAGPVPHLPEDGKVVSFGPKSSTAAEVASGAPLVVDAEFGRGRTLFALSQGVFGGGAPGSPALPNTGSLVRVNRNGTFTVVAGGLDRPTSLEFIGNTAYVVTLSGQIWKLDVSGCDI
jgi:sugar lactone lactonase YvrE